MFVKERLNRFGGYGIERLVNIDANAELTFAHAEGSAELNLILQIIFCDKILKLFNDLSRTLEMARASDTYCYFHYFIPFTY